MKKILSLLQILIKSSLIFLLTFIWLRFFIHTTWIALVISFSSTLLLQILLFFVFEKRKTLNSLKSQEKEDADNMFFSLVNINKPIIFFKNLVSTRHNNINYNTKYIKIIHENKKNTILYPFLSLKSINVDDLIKIIKQTKKEKPSKIVVICNSYDNDCLKFTKNFDFEITLLDKYETYEELYKEYEFYPEITNKYKKESKLKFSDLLFYSFNKERAKGYIFSAITLLIMSFFVKLNVYYYVIVSILLMLSIISLTNKKYNIKKYKELL